VPAGSHVVTGSPNWFCPSEGTFGDEVTRSPID